MVFSSLPAIKDIGHSTFGTKKNIRHLIYNITEPVTDSVFDPYINSEIARSYKMELITQSLLHGILVLNILLKLNFGKNNQSSQLKTKCTSLLRQ